MSLTACCNPELKPSSYSLTRPCCTARGKDHTCRHYRLYYVADCCLLLPAICLLKHRCKMSLSSSLRSAAYNFLRQVQQARPATLLAITTSDVPASICKTSRQEASSQVLRNEVPDSLITHARFYVLIGLLEYDGKLGPQEMHGRNFLCRYEQCRIPVMNARVATDQNRS